MRFLANNRFWATAETERFIIWNRTQLQKVTNIPYASCGTVRFQSLDIWHLQKSDIVDFHVLQEESENAEKNNKEFLIVIRIRYRVNQ